MLQTTGSSNVIASVSHPDPYPYYSSLVDERPLYYDEALKAWVASSAEAVEAFLSHPGCSVRPISAPVPGHLINSTAGTIFQHLIRMTGGEKQAKVKSAIEAQIKAIPFHRLTELSDYRAAHLLQQSHNLNQFAADLPVYVMAELIEIPSSEIIAIVELVQTFALCLNPLNETHQVEKGKFAAENLMQIIQTINSPFVKQLAEKTSPDIAAANSIGLLFQSYEATNGLIGNTVHTLAVYPELREQLIGDDNLLQLFIKEVIRWNPPVQNTRRYLTTDATISGQKMSIGDVIIVVLAAANRDKQVNPQPHQFQLQRNNRQSYTFGSGHHACIGEMIALNITKAALQHIQAANLDQLIDPLAITYQAYGNLRIPVLTMKAGENR